MNTKLTLNINNMTIINAKKYAGSQQQSLSKLVENYLNGITKIKKSEEKLTPLVNELSGCVSLTNIKNYKKKYADYLLEKYS